MTSETALLVAGILKELVGLVMDIMADGKDPIVEIKRVRRSKEWMAGVREKLEADVKRKLGG